MCERARFFHRWRYSRNFYRDKRYLSGALPPLLIYKRILNARATRESGVIQVSQSCKSCANHVNLVNRFHDIGLSFRGYLRFFRPRYLRPYPSCLPINQIAADAIDLAICLLSDAWVRLSRKTIAQKHGLLRFCWNPRANRASEYSEERRHIFLSVLYFLENCFAKDSRKKDAAKKDLISNPREGRKFFLWLH